MRTLDDYVFDGISWWHPRMGACTVASLTKRANHNGYPEATEQDVRDAMDRLADMGALNKGWY